jgi:hypothetical protein
VLGPFMWPPQLTFTLISIPTLDRIGFRTVLYNGEASVTFNGEVTLSGTLKDGLYHLDPVYVEQLGGDTESDTPERAPADEIVMTTSACELKSLDNSLRGIAKVVEGVQSVVLASDQTSATECVEDTRVRGGNETAPGCYGYRGGNSALQYSNIWERDGGGNKTAPGCYGYRGGNLALQESVPLLALMSLGPEDRVVGFSLLDVMHVRLGHMSERNIKYAVKNHLYSGCNVTFD